MSITRNRELSQFGSFIYIDNDNQSIGIATEILPNVGIGTTNPTVKFEVNGDTNIGGNLTIIGGSIEASSYTLNGNPLIDVGIGQWLFGSNEIDIYRLMGNIGIGTSVNSEKLTVLGNVSAGKFISTVGSGTAPFEVSSTTLVTNLNADYLRGKTPPSGDIVGNDDAQILTNKTINLSNNTLGGTFSQFNAALSDVNLDFVSTTGTETLTNKTLTTPIISGIRPSAGQLQTIPSGSGTLLSTNSTNVITSGMIVDGTIVNEDISATAAIAISKLASSTISGVSLGSNLNNLTAGSFINYSSGTTYNGSTAITISANASSLNTANTLVARNASGDFTAGTITGSAFDATVNGFRINGTTVINSGRNLVSVVNGSFSGVVNATDFNSTSDINLKTNINTVTNPLETINSLRGVTFNWKETGSSSIGVIAQELQEVLPELVSDGEIKSVNYNGLIGVLIEAVKSQQKEINNLKNEIELLKDAR